MAPPEIQSGNGRTRAKGRGRRKGAGGRQVRSRGLEGEPARGQELQIQLNAHTSPTLSPKCNRGAPETVSALPSTCASSSWKMQALPGRMPDEMPAKISSTLVGVLESLRAKEEAGAWESGRDF